MEGMINMSIKININNWKRKSTYLFFKDYTNPYISVISELDITNIYNIHKKYNYSFYGLMSYVSLKAMSNIEEFYVGYKQDDLNEIYRFDNLAISNTIINKDDCLDFTDYIEYKKGIELKDFLLRFSEKELEAINGNKEFNSVLDSHRIYATTLPNIKFSGFSEPINSNYNDSAIRLCWGKYYDNCDKKNINYSILVNHCFEDGKQIGEFFEALQYEIDLLGDYDEK